MCEIRSKTRLTSASAGQQVAQSLAPPFRSTPKQHSRRPRRIRRACHMLLGDRSRETSSALVWVPPLVSGGVWVHALHPPLWHKGAAGVPDEPVRLVRAACAGPGPWGLVGGLSPTRQPARWAAFALARPPPPDDSKPPPHPPLRGGAPDLPRLTPGHDARPHGAQPRPSPGPTSSWQLLESSFDGARNRTGVFCGPPTVASFRSLESESEASCAFGRHDLEAHRCETEHRGPYPSQSRDGPCPESYACCGRRYRLLTYKAFPPLICQPVRWPD